MVAENMIQAALTSSARAWLLSKLGCGPAGCGPSPPVLQSSPLEGEVDPCQDEHTGA